MGKLFSGLTRMRNSLCGSCTKPVVINKGLRWGKFRGKLA